MKPSLAGIATCMLCVFSFNNLLGQPPVNDNCSNATSLSINGGCVNGTTLNASIEGGESTLCFTSGAGCNATQSVWYTFNTGTNTALWLDLDQTNSSNCAGGYAVYGPFGSTTCLPSIINQVTCQNFLPALGGTMLSGLSTNSTYMVQVIGRNGGGSSDRHLEFCLAVETPVSCTSCGNVCGNACGFYTQPTVATVTSTCPEYNLTPHLNTGDIGTYCYDFVANNDTVDFQIIISGSGCNLGNIVTMNWQVYDASGCGQLGSGIFPNLQMTGLTPNSAYTFCYTMTTACVHLSHYPYFVGAQPILLPIDLTSFRGNAYSFGNELYWTAETESTYEVERSTDGENFTRLEMVVHATGKQQMPGSLQEIALSKLSAVSDHKGQTSDFIYRYTDRHAPSGKSYYRLAQLEENGDRSYSEIITVNRSSASEGGLSGFYPSPSTGTVNIDIHLTKNQSLSYSIYNASGRVMDTFQREFSLGSNQLQIDLSHYAKGLYFFHFNVEGQSYVRNVILK